MLQNPTTLLRCIKTKKGTLTSTISYEAATELTGMALETIDILPTDAKKDTNILDSNKEGRLAVGKDDRTIELDNSK